MTLQLRVSHDEHWHRPVTQPLLESNTTLVPHPMAVYLAVNADAKFVMEWKLAPFEPFHGTQVWQLLDYCPCVRVQHINMPPIPGMTARSCCQVAWPSTPANVFFCWPFVAGNRMVAIGPALTYRSARTGRRARSTTRPAKAGASPQWAGKIVGRRILPSMVWGRTCNIEHAWHYPMPSYMDHASHGNNNSNAHVMGGLLNAECHMGLRIEKHK